jgi:hypothetical protein
MTPRHLIVIAAIALLAIPLTASADEAEARLPALEAEIDSLRTGGHFAQAVEPAREMLSLVRHDPDTPAYVVSDAELTVKVLEELAALPAESRAQLVAASGLRVGMEEALEAGDQDDAGQSPGRRVSSARAP